MTETKPSIRSLIFVFLGCFLYFVPICLLELDPYDEAIRLYGAEEVLAGRRPYQDFYAIYGAGQFVVTAAILHLADHQLAAVRIVLALVNAGIGTIVFGLLSRLQVSRAYSLAVVALFLVARHSSGNALYSSGPEMMFLLLVAVLFCQATGTQNGIVIGVLLGLVSWFRHDFAVYGSLAAILAIASTDADVRSRLKGVTQVCLFAVGVSLIFYAFFAWPSPSKVWENLIVYPSITVPFRDVPYPWDEVAHRLTAIGSLLSPRTILSRTALMELTPLIVLMMPWVAISLAVILGFHTCRRSFYRKLKSVGNTSIRFLAFLAVGLSFYGFMRCDTWHLFPLFVVLLVLSCKLLSLWVETCSMRFQWRFGATLALVGCGCAAFIGVGRTSDYFGREPLDHPRCRWIRCIDSSAFMMTRIAAELKSLPGEGPVFVGALNHQRVISNPILIYFLAGRRSGTYFHHFDPGVTTSEWGQRRIMADLESSQTSTLLLLPLHVQEEPNRSSESSNVTLLDDYIRARYMPVHEEESFSLWTRRP